MRRQIVSTMYNNGDYFYFQNNFLCFCIYVTNVCSAFILSPISKYRASDVLRGCGAAKFTKTRWILQNLLEILSHTCQYNIFETYLGNWGCVVAVNLQIYLETSSPPKSNIKHAQVISAKFINFQWNLPRKLLQNQPFFTDWFSVTLALNIPTKSADFSVNLSLKILRNLTFFSTTYLKPQNSK